MREVKDPGISPSGSARAISSPVGASTYQSVNINVADAETLQTLKDIGSVTVLRNIDSLNKNGPFEKNRRH